MAEQKKFYWLRLKRDFFKRHDIQIIEAMPNGKDYVLFYLKLLCESVDHEGSLRFSNQIPYNEEMLSTITRTNIDIVKAAIQLFANLGMIEIWDDGTLFMSECQKLMGCETEWAEKKRAYRELHSGAKIELPETTENGQKEDTSRTMSSESGQSPIRDRDRERERDKDIYNSCQSSGEKMPKYQDFVDLYHQLCPSLPKVQKLTEGRKSAIKARWLEYPDIEIFKSVFTKCENNQFMKGKNDRNWVANFDFIFQASSFTKIVEGFYDKMGKPTVTQAQAPKKPLLEGSSFDTTDFYAAALKRTSGGK